ncbi:hypothetical protein PtB15_5B723 [Puccinia triticina]|nr:hypothetical protein PtB15_5B723 [Puccinia triticina]
MKNHFYLEHKANSGHWDNHCCRQFVQHLSKTDIKYFCVKNETRSPERISGGEGSGAVGGAPLEVSNSWDQLQKAIKESDVLGDGPTPTNSLAAHVLLVSNHLKSSGIYHHVKNFKTKMGLTSVQLHEAIDLEEEVTAWGGPVEDWLGDQMKTLPDLNFQLRKAGLKEST